MINIKAVSINISEKKGTAKEPRQEIVLDRYGVKGDAHAGHWHRQVSMLSADSIRKFSKEADKAIGFGEFAENITVEGIDTSKCNIFDRFSFGEVELELTQVGKKCHGHGCSIFNEVGRCVMPKEGVFLRVVKGGIIKNGDTGVYQPVSINARVITLSDRAAAGEYEDRSGPAARQILESFFADKNYDFSVTGTILPDDRELLGEELDKCAGDGTDIIITTGGTGIGPRDVAADVVSDYIDREIPGIMEHIRLKYGADNPKALISRSIAGVKGMSQVYALPGSSKAVKEYMAEIVQVLEHSMYMLRGVDLHC